MMFDWDEEKRQANIVKHHIDFEEAIIIYDDFVITAASEQQDLAEERFIFKFPHVFFIGFIVT
jgi:uncharacterized DUF497 family protein